MTKTLTSANAVYTLSITDLFDFPVTLQGFAADDIFRTTPLASSEVSMGVDGVLSAGFRYVPTEQTVSLQADSDSNAVFEQWWEAQQIQKDVYYASGVIVLISVNKTWTMTKGVLTSYPPIPDTATILQPRRYGITWERVSPADIE